ncbi:MAG: hypothetical protein ACI9TY_000879 [Alphaproteobacteria bacterium]|jgi:hypothetical protein
MPPPKNKTFIAQLYSKHITSYFIVTFQNGLIHSAKSITGISYNEIYLQIQDGLMEACALIPLHKSQTIWKSLPDESHRFESVTIMAKQKDAPKVRSYFI